MAQNAVERACRLIEQRGGEPVTLAELGRAAGVSPYHLQRLFRKTLGVSPREYAEALRVRKFKGEVRKGKAVTEALYEAGFGSPRGLYEKAGATLGMRPARYRKGAAGEVIHYHISRCRLGLVLLAATEKGVCAVLFGDAAAELGAQLRGEFPHAELKAAGPALMAWTEALVSSIERNAPPPELPLDIRATAFQQQVWNHLRTIGRGETRTYGELAAQIGRPEAVRAVARACATNRLAMLIPCHRVIGADGALSGYRWGVERKRTLLNLEASGAARAVSE